MKRSSLEEMFQYQKSIDAFAKADVKESQVGLTFMLSTNKSGMKLIGHGGNQNGFITLFYLSPSTRSAYVVAFNTLSMELHKLYKEDLQTFLFEHFFPACK